MQISSKLKSHTRTGTSHHETPSCCLQNTSSASSSRQGAPLETPLRTDCLIGQVPGSHSQALSHIITILELYTADKPPNAEGHPTTSPSLRVPSELTSIHCTTPAMTITPPRFLVTTTSWFSHSTMASGFSWLLPILCALVQIHYSWAIGSTLCVTSCDTWLQAACTACNMQLSCDFLKVFLKQLPKRIIHFNI